jgi:hypothetical protein
MKAELEIGIADCTSDGSMHTSRAPFNVSVPTANWEDARKTGLGYQKEWLAAPDTTRVRVIVHDVRSGKYGSIEIPLQ